MTDTGQVVSSAAEFYDQFFVPALFGAWAPRLVAAAELEPPMRVADIACGTGVLAVEASKAVSPGGVVFGLDLNPGMLSVARRKHSEVQWQEAAAESLPFGDHELDAVLSQFGLMFFADKAAALSEMWRVLRPGGRLVIGVWDSLDNAPGYAAVTALLARLFGDAIADLLRSPYSLGDAQRLRSLLADAGAHRPDIEQLPGEARFASIRAWMECDVRGWTLAGKLDEAQLERLVSEAERELQPFVAEDGSVRFAHPALVATATKPKSV